MSSENHVPRISKREIRGAAIGAAAGAILGIIIATGTNFAQPFDAVVMILKWTLVWMIVGATFSWSMLLDVSRWIILGAIVGIIVGAVIAILNPSNTNRIDTVLIAVGVGIFTSSLIGAIRWVKHRKYKSQSAA